MAEKTVTEEAWEEALDVDDSDLKTLTSSPFLRHCSNSHHLLSHLRCSPPLSQPQPQPSPSPSPSPPAAAVAVAVSGDASPHRIPGPASAVQAAMHRRSSACITAAAASDERAGESMDLGAAADTVGEDDGDFKINPWLCAMRFLGEERAWKRPGIGAIGARTFHRAPRVVGVVKSCMPNGLGDLFLTLKDPTGTIGASVHRKVLSEGNLGSDISVGCVVVLKQVVVFCPARSVFYLNVTLENVVKVLGRDCGPPTKKVVPSVTARCQLPGKHIGTGEGASETAAATSTSNRTSRMDMDTGYGLENQQETRIHEVAGGLHKKQIADNTANEHLQRNLDGADVGAMLPNLGGISAKIGHGASTETVANEKMRRLLSAEWIISNSKKATAAELFRDNGATPTISNSVSRVDANPNIGAEEHQEIGLHERAKGDKHISNFSTSDDLQQHFNSAKAGSMQLSLGGSSAKFASRAATETTTIEKIRGILGREWLTSGSIKGRIDEVLSDNSGATSMSNSISRTGTSVDYSSEKEERIGLHEMVGDPFHKHNSDHTASDHLQQKFDGAIVGCTQLSVGGSSSPRNNASSVSGLLSSQPGNQKNEPKKLIPVVSAAGWTDEQLSELFVDY